MSFISRSYNWKLSVAALLIIIAVAQSFINVHHYGIETGLAIADALCSTSLLYIFLLFLPPVFNYYLPSLIRHIGLIIQSTLLTAIWFFAYKNIAFSLFHNNVSHEAFMEQSAWVKIFVAWILILNFYILKQLIAVMKMEQKSIDEDQKAVQFRKEGELFKLRQQLQPHFLFNSLNSINALIGQDTAQARKMVQQLSDYLRKNLKKEDHDFIPFQEEYTDLKLYLSIEEIRFGNRLALKEKISEDCNNKSIPPFLLQPLIENAIKHGLYGTTGQVVIQIEANVRQSEEASTFIFSITNPFDPSSVSTDGAGFGLNAIQKRLYLLFSRNDLLVVEEKREGDQSIFRATLKIPTN